MPLIPTAWKQSLLIFWCICFFVCLFAFLSVLGLHCRARAFSSCGERGLLFVAVRGARFGAPALGAGASVVAARGLSSCGTRALECRLSSCGARA